MGMDNFDNFDAPSTDGIEVGDATVGQWRAETGEEPVGEHHIENMETGNLPKLDEKHPNVIPLYPDEGAGVMSEKEFGQKQLLPKKKAA